MHPAKVLYEEPKTEIELNNESQKAMSSRNSLGLRKFLMSTVMSQTYQANILATTVTTTTEDSDSTDGDLTCSDDSDDSDENSFGSSRSSGYSKQCAKNAKIVKSKNKFEKNQSTKNQKKLENAAHESKLKNNSKPDSTALNEFIKRLKEEEYTPSESNSTFSSELRSKLSFSKQNCLNNILENSREYSMFEMIDVEDCWLAWDYENQSNKLPLSENMAQRLNEHPKNNIICVSFGRIHFNCHRIILRYSQLFHTLEQKSYEFKIGHEMTPIAFMHFYEFAMGIKPAIMAKHFLDVLKAAEVLNVHALHLYCMQLLDSALYHEHNAFVVYKAAKRYFHLGMQRLMLQRIWKFFLPFVATKYFLELEVNEVCRFLEADTVGVNSEIEIFYAAVLWLNAKWKKRRGKSLERIMKCVRYGLLPPWFTYSLKRGTGITEVDRVLESKFVCKMIEDGASIAATIGLYFVEPSKFESILNRLLPKVPKQRNWVFDKNSTYHYGAHEKVSEAVDFMVFKDYLKILELESENYWRCFQEANDDHMVKIFCQKFSEWAWSKMQF